jgi:hypothetical protein
MPLYLHVEGETPVRIVKPKPSRPSMPSRPRNVQQSESHIAYMLRSLSMTPTQPTSCSVFETRLPHCAHWGSPLSQVLRDCARVVSVKSLYMTRHLLPPAGSLGFWLLSISWIIRSNALSTFSLYRALVSVQAHLNSAASALPSSGVTWRCSGRRSDLLPTMTMGTQSMAYKWSC